MRKVKDLVNKLLDAKQALPVRLLVEGERYNIACAIEDSGELILIGKKMELDDSYAVILRKINKDIAKV